MEAQQQAKQLDSVTDFVQESELDASKMQQAMSALSTSKQEDDPKAAALAAVEVSKEDVALIVSELEVTDAVAERALREVAVDGEESKMLEAALRKLVTL
jgi:NACalpha-BTF3-like transcription factor